MIEEAIYDKDWSELFGKLHEKLSDLSKYFGISKKQLQQQFIQKIQLSQNLKLQVASFLSAKQHQAALTKLVDFSTECQSLFYSYIADNYTKYQMQEFWINAIYCVH